MQLAQSSALKRSLTNLGNAIQNGDMTTANTLLTQFIKDNPQYAAGSSSATQLQDPISKDFQTLATAVSSNQVGAAQSAWKQVTTDLSKDGVNLSSSAGSTAEIVAQSQTAMDQQIISDIFGTGSSDTSSLATILGQSANSSSSVGLSSSLLGSWVTYQQGGNAIPSTTSSSLGNILNTAA
jgi:hypothetical protein